MTTVKSKRKVILRYESTDGGRLKGGADVGGLFGDAQPRHTFMKVEFGTGGLRCEKCASDEIINSVLRKENSPTFEFKGGRDNIVIAAAMEPATRDKDGPIGHEVYVYVSDNAEQMFKDMLNPFVEEVAEVRNLDILTMKSKAVEQEFIIKALKEWKK